MDDIIIFGEWDRANMINMMFLIQCFYIVLGLKINLQKSSLFDCKPNKLPFYYLGLLDRHNMTRVASWVLIIEKFKKKMYRWKINTLFDWWWEY